MFEPYIISNPLHQRYPWHINWLHLKEKKSFIWIKTSFEGFHCYPDAPEEVAYLRSPHRHIFHVKVNIEVFHNERDLEFHMFKKFVTSLFSQKEDFNSKSCESISDLLYENITVKYPGRDIFISVSEDDENGSEIYYEI